MLLEQNAQHGLNGPMHFLAQAIADLATIVTFQQRWAQPPAHETKHSQAGSRQEFPSPDTLYDSPAATSIQHGGDDPGR